MRVLGIDPGLRITGYGCIEGLGDRPALIEGGVFRLGRNGAVGRSAASVSSRLLELDRDFGEALERLKPDVVAVEAIFSHSKHPATSIVMAHARGVILLAVHRRGLRLVELKPNEVKKSITGHGHAGKGQMQSAIQAQFGLSTPPRPPDVADALAIALCGARRLGRSR